MLVYKNLMYLTKSQSYIGYVIEFYLFKTDSNLGIWI